MKFHKVCYLWLLIALSAHGQPNPVLYYYKPAATWTEALPIGNDRLGAMVFGKVNEEVL